MEASPPHSAKEKKRKQFMQSLFGLVFVFTIRYLSWFIGCDRDMKFADIKWDERRPAH